MGCCAVGVLSRYLTIFICCRMLGTEEHEGIQLYSTYPIPTNYDSYMSMSYMYYYVKIGNCNFSMFHMVTKNAML